MEKGVCIILARGGSKGVVGKNLRKVGGVSLVARSIKAAQNAEHIAETYVSTDCPQIAKEAQACGALPILRPACLASDEASSEAGWLHALEYLQAQGASYVRAVFLQCTSCFTTGAEIDAALVIMADAEVQSTVSVTPDHGFMWRIADDGSCRGINHDCTLPRLRRQDRMPQYRETGAIYAVDVASFQREQTRFCGETVMQIVHHPAIEIDTEADLELCNAIAATQSGGQVASLRDMRLLVMDFDGVHTDDRVYVDETGREMVAASRRDGLGLSRLKAHTGVDSIILSTEANPVVLARGRKLGVEVYHGVRDKSGTLAEIIESKSILWSQVAYIGNDINDLDAMRCAAFSACPMDAHPEIRLQSDWVIPARGGHGALRILCERLIEAQNV